MILELTFWIAFIFVSQVIAKIYYRRRDVLHGPYRATRRGRGSKPDERSRQKFNHGISQGAEARAFASPHQTRHYASRDYFPAKTQRRALPINQTRKATIKDTARSE
jgi:hypothetical protein